MVLAFESTQQTFGAFWAGVGALIICTGIFGVWRMGRPTTTLDRWGRWLYLLAVAMGGSFFIWFGWFVYHS